MRAFINGLRCNGDSLTLYKAGDQVLQAILMNDDGSVLNLTGGSFAFLVYSDPTRATLSATHNGVLVTATGGRGTITLTNAAMNYGTGTFYGFMKYTDAGSLISYDGYMTLTIK